MGQLIEEIHAAVEEGRPKEPFSPNDVIRAGVQCDPVTPATFLPKHRVGNPGGNTELFIRVSKGRYKLK